MGQPTGGMSRSASIRIGRARSPSGLTVPGVNSGRPKSADVIRRDNSFSRLRSPSASTRRSGSFCSTTRPNTTDADINELTLKVPTISIRRPSTDDTGSDTASCCSSRSRTPSPFGWIERENLPPGSPTFRRAMEEFRSESDLSGEENSDDSSVKIGVPTKKSESKVQSRITPRKSSAYKVVRHGARVTVIRNTKR